jgi:hypothetical protein
MAASPDGFPYGPSGPCEASFDRREFSPSPDQRSDQTRPRRCVRAPSPRDWDYPPETVQTDLLAFSMIFTQLWSVLGKEGEFGSFYDNKRPALGEFECIVTHCSDRSMLPEQCGFWNQNKCGDFVPLSPADEPGMRELCRTLRNGFGHFNFRYDNRTPHDFFNRLGLRRPPVVLKPDVAYNYRVFIWDHWSKTTFGDPDTDSRLVGTHFAPLRYHLFVFLARFFCEPGEEPYDDIIYSGQKVPCP